MSVLDRYLSHGLAKVHDRVHEVLGFLYQSVAEFGVDLETGQLSLNLDTGQLRVAPSQELPEGED